MAIPSIHKFITEVVRPGNFARQYNYTVFFTAPSGMSNSARERVFGEFASPAVRPPRITEGILLRCEAIVFPGQNISTTGDDLRMGPLRDHASNVTYGDITATFLCSADLAERRFFEEWHDMIFNKDFQMGYYNRYITNMVIKQYNEANRNTYSMKVHEVYPKSFADMELTTAEKTSLLKFTVTFSFYKYKRIKVDEVRRTGQEAIGGSSTAGSTESQENRGQGGAGGPDAA